MGKVILALTVILAIGAQSSALAQTKLKVLSDGPLEPGLVKVAEYFRRDTGHEVEFVFGTSPVVHKKVVGGEVADVVIIQPNFVDELAKAGKVIAEKKPEIGRIGVGLATRANGPALDISTTEAFKQVLLRADALFHNNVASGDYFAKVLERLGIAEAVKGKSVRISPAEVFERVIKGTGNDIGVAAITLIVAEKRLRLVGPLPPEVQSYIIYTAVPMASAKSPSVGGAFIEYLRTPGAKAALMTTGVE